MIKKNTLIYLVFLFLFISTLILGIFYFFIIILSGYIIFKIITGNKILKKKKEIMKDYLTHEYGEKMGNYILNKVMEKRKK